MVKRIITRPIDRRTLLKTAAAAGVLQIASPFVTSARAADNIKIGLHTVMLQNAKEKLG